MRVEVGDASRVLPNAPGARPRSPDRTWPGAVNCCPPAGARRSTRSAPVLGARASRFGSSLSWTGPPPPRPAAHRRRSVPRRRTASIERLGSTSKGRRGRVPGVPGAPRRAHPRVRAHEHRRGWSRDRAVPPGGAQRGAERLPGPRDGCTADPGGRSRRAGDPTVDLVVDLPPGAAESAAELLAPLERPTALRGRSAAHPGRLRSGAGAPLVVWPRDSPPRSSSAALAVARRRLRWRSGGRSRVR